MYEFDGYRVDRHDRTVYCGDRTVPLPPKAVDVLLELLRTAGSVVHRDALIEAVWPGTFVEEANLTQMIFLLRKALGYASDGGRIVTIPCSGYSFTGEVRVSHIHTPTAGSPRSVAASAACGTTPGTGSAARKRRSRS